MTKIEQKETVEILERRANEVAGFSDDYRKNPTHLGSVELALTREVHRLRMLAAAVKLIDPETGTD